LTRRRARELEILEVLRNGPASAIDIVDAIYDDLARGLRGVAARTVWAHLRKLGREERALCVEPDDLDATWTLVE
jgi:hypothetical protein